MKKILLISATLFFLLNVNAQNVGIGTTTPAASAQLEISSSNKGSYVKRYEGFNMFINGTT